MKRGPIRAASRELTTFVLVRWRSAYVPDGKAESARALPSRIRCGLHDQRKRSQELSGINCVAATIQLAGREAATFDCSVDRRLGHTCGPCCAPWCVHRCVALKPPLSCSHAGVKDWLSYAAEQRRKASIVIPSSPSTNPRGLQCHTRPIRLRCSGPRQSRRTRRRSTVLLDVKDILQVGPLQWGRIIRSRSALLAPAFNGRGLFRSMATTNKSLARTNKSLA